MTSKKEFEKTGDSVPDDGSLWMRGMETEDLTVLRKDNVEIKRVHRL